MEKKNLHARNLHRKRYDFEALCQTNAALQPFVNVNKHGNPSIDFFNPVAVKLLNSALLEHHYGITDWDIPEGYLCPPVPGRADYLHYAADILASINKGRHPKGADIRLLDIGVGANCIYPILGSRLYGWQFVGSDIDPQALQAAQQTITKNSCLHGQIKLRLQSKIGNLFQGIVTPKETFDLVICNPPFHSSEAEATEQSLRKLQNLKATDDTELIRNFAGQAHERYCEGGERQFVGEMIYQSKQFSKNCLWFSSLVSQQAHLPYLYNIFDEVEAVEIRTIPMAQGNKISRIIAWTYHTKQEQYAWMNAKSI